MMHLIVLLALAGSASISPTPSNPGAVVRAATVQGRITTTPSPAKRVANRYVGAASPAKQQSLPVIVFLRGAGLPAARGAAKPQIMTQRDTVFSPSFLIVPRGSSVGFQNLDPFYHNVFSYSKAKRFDLGRFPKPESKSISFDKVGAIDVFCEIHSSMRAVVLVTDNDFHAELQPDGSYSLPGVPAGRYELVVWHPDRGQKVVPITVPASGVLTINSSI
ncbi:MAG: carboxypeptidase regulatory-like domain-containing protein [Longimicrobiales bacterium]